ncbi:MAG: peptidylprolyl isomerase [Candidatus Competibacteraceae bacterium]
MSKKPLLAALLGLGFTLGISGVLSAAEEKSPSPVPAGAPAQPSAATPAQPPAQPPAAAEKKPVPDPVAVVNGVPIPKSLYDIYAQQWQARMGDSDTPAARKALIDNLVLQELLLQQAQQQHLTEDPQVIQQMEMAKRNVLIAAMQRKILSEKAPNSDIDLTSGRLREPSEEEIKKEYDSRVAAMGKKEYKVRHILVDSEEKAKNLIEQLKKEKGANFSELAKTNSSDSTAAQGGDLDWINLGDMVPPFGQAVSKLEKGKFTEQPVKTDFGWHIIILDDIRDTTPPPLEEVRPQIVQALQQATQQRVLEQQRQILRDYIENLRKNAKVEIK